MANSIGQSINNLTVKSIRSSSATTVKMVASTNVGYGSGSTTVSILVSTNAGYGSSDLQQQQTKLQNTISSSIAGMPVNTWSVVINNRNQTSNPSPTTNKDSSISMALILGIAIPVGVLCTYIFIQ
jgi:type III secretory pathway lipoprotein EscJ